MVICRQHGICLKDIMHDCGSLFRYGICADKYGVWLAVTDSMYMMGFITRHPWYIVGATAESSPTPTGSALVARGGPCAIAYMLCTASIPRCERMHKHARCLHNRSVYAPIRP